MAVFEAVGYQLGNMGAGNVMDNHVLHARVGKLDSQYIGSIFRIAVHGSIGDHNATDFRLICAPDIIFSNDIIQIASPDRSME